MIPIHCHPKMVADANSYSPSAGKADQVIRAFRHRFPQDTQLLKSEPSSRLVLGLAHNPDYIDGVLGGTIANGFNNTSPAVAAALPYQVGSLVSACRWVVTDRRRSVACSPSSGFHHARWASAHGYCTFNGLIAAAMYLKTMGMAQRIGIVDFDYHEGDGTQAIIDQLGLGDWINHWSAGAEYKAPRQAKEFLASITTGVKQMSDCDLVIYQAGADQHIDDPLGGLLTDEQMAQRDRSVFWTCREYRIPVVWNLAGGYRRDLTGGIDPVVDTHCETMRQCIDIFLKDGGGKL